jgi:hypothetical protein
MNDGNKKKYGIYAGPPLRRLIAERRHDQRTPTGVVNTVADRYREIVQRSVPALTLAEWAWVLAALRHHPTGDDALALATLWSDLAATPHAAGGRDGQALDAPALLAKLRQLSYAETVALVDVAERYWIGFAASTPLQEALPALGVRIPS